MTDRGATPHIDEIFLDAVGRFAQLRVAERASLRRAQAVIAALERMATAKDPTEALEALLAAMREHVVCDASALLVADGTSVVTEK